MMQTGGNSVRRHASSQGSAPQGTNGVGANPIAVGLPTEMSRFVKQTKRLRVLLKVIGVLPFFPTSLA